MREDIDLIKQHVDIVDILGSCIQLTRAGRNFKAICPFHQEKTPSFMVSPERQTWRCFGACQEGGDVISFLMKWENSTFFEVLQELSKKTGIPLKTTGEEDVQWQKKKVLFDINTLAAKLYNYILTRTETGKAALEYLHMRGLSDKTITTFELGYAPNTKNRITQYLTSKKFSLDDIVNTGLTGRTADNQTYDRFRDRIMFPIKDHKGVTIGFSGRIIKEVDQAKYINTPETTIYHKRETLFGIHLSKKYIQENNAAIIVEGEFDMISLFQNGFGNVVAIKGSAFTKEQLTLIKRFTDRLILALDTDTSGFETTKRTVLEAEAMDFRVDIADMGEHKDPDSALQKNPIAFKKAIQKPLSAFDFIIEKVMQKNSGEGGYEKKHIADELIPFINTISNPILRDHYTKKIAEKLQVTEQAISESLIELRHKKELAMIVHEDKNVHRKVDRTEYLEQLVMALILQAPSVKKQIKDFLTILDVSDFEQPSFQALLKHLEDYFNKKNDDVFDPKEFVTALEPQLHEAFDKAFLFDISNAIDMQNEHDVKKRIFEFKLLGLKKGISALIEKLKHTSDDETLTQQLQDLTRKRADIEKKLAMM